MKKIPKQRFKRKLLISSLAAITTGLIATSVSQASDIDVYQTAQAGDITLMFMLDISGSMSTYNSTRNRVLGYACDLPSNVRESGYNSSATTPAIANGPEYRRQWCIGNDGKRYYDRITRLKDGMMDLLYGNPDAGITRLSDEKVIGLSTLGAISNNSYKDTGAVLIPARRLDAVINGTTQRQLLIDRIGNFNIFSNTPTSRSYAETVAYLMGTTTASYQRYVQDMEYYRSATYQQSGRTTTVIERCDSWRSSLACNRWEDATSIPNQDQLTARSCAFTVDRVTRNGTCYDLTGIVESTTAEGSGFIYSDPLTKDGNVYASPTSLNQTVTNQQCSGQGIYVLTDGEPTNDTLSQNLAKGALGADGPTFSCDNSSWNCIHNLAANILDETKNPKKLKFKTAVVGRSEERR